jgi:hypothetical protein
MGQAASDSSRSRHSGPVQSWSGLQDSFEGQPHAHPSHKIFPGILDVQDEVQDPLVQALCESGVANAHTVSTRCSAMMLYQENECSWSKALKRSQHGIQQPCLCACTNKVLMCLHYIHAHVPALATALMTACATAAPGAMTATSTWHPPSAGRQIRHGHEFSTDCKCLP